MRRAGLGVVPHEWWLLCKADPALGPSYLKAGTQAGALPCAGTVLVKGWDPGKCHTSRRLGDPILTKVSCDDVHLDLSVLLDIGYSLSLWH